MAESLDSHVGVRDDVGVVSKKLERRASEIVDELVTEDRLRMNPEIKAAWVRALRSGEYEQGRGRLNLNGKYCCLGVLCELAVKARVIPEPVVAPHDNEDGILYGSGMDHSRSVLPQSVAQWADLGGSMPDVFIDGWPRGLTSLNDGEENSATHAVTGQKSFAEIADLIEEWL